MFATLRNGPLARLLRYGVVGLSVNGAGYLAYLLLTWAGLAPQVAVTVLFPIGLWAAFRLHGRFTFGSERRDRATVIRFIAVSLTGYVLNVTLLTLLIDGAGIPHQLAQLVSLGLVALVMFQLTRRLVFPPDPPAV